MVTYSKGKIYMICPNVEYEEGEVYIGSTTKHYLSDRLFGHKKMYESYKIGKVRGRLAVYDLFDKYGSYNCEIILIESVNANSKAELFTREAYHIKNSKCVNKMLPINTREDILNRKKIYREKNHDQIQAYSESRRTKHKCECGGCYTTEHKNLHMKTLMHSLYLNTLMTPQAISP